MTGWSNGGYISSEYAINYPEKIAAVVPMSAGLPYENDELPDDFCEIGDVPVWLFHETQDEVISFANTINAIGPL